MAEELTTKEMRTMISLINKLVNGAGSWIEKVSESLQAGMRTTKNNLIYFRYGG